MRYNFHMEIVAWAGIHWIELLQSVGIIGSLLFTGYTVRADSKERKVQSTLALTAAHREIWSNLYEHPKLARVLQPGIDVGALTKDEELFVQMLILHLRSSFKARQSGMYFHENGLRLDIKDFFSLPVPRAVWEKTKKYQDLDFVKFVESCG